MNLSYELPRNASLLARELVIRPRAQGVIYCIVVY